MELKIDLESDTNPVMGPMNKLSVSELPEIETQITKSLEKDYIGPGISLSGSPVLLTNKKDECLRMRIVNRELNKKNIRNKVPLRRIYQVWAQIGDSEHFSLIDSKYRYH